MIKLDEFITDLEMLYDEKLSCVDFRDKYFQTDSPSDLDEIPDLIGSLSHYLDDEDIRLKDEWTRSMQKFEMKKLISLLKSGASEEEMQNISFLGYSD